MKFKTVMGGQGARATKKLTPQQVAAARARSLKESERQAFEILARVVEEQFATHGRYGTTPPWRDLAESTYRRPRGSQGGRRRIDLLRVDDQLARSLTLRGRNDNIFRVTSKTIEYGTRVRDDRGHEFASVHQFGGTTPAGARIPKRVIIPTLNEEDRQELSIVIGRNITRRMFR